MRAISSSPRALTDGQELRAEIRDQIEYEYLVTPANQRQVDELVEIMLEVAMNRSRIRAPFRVSGRIFEHKKRAG